MNFYVFVFSTLFATCQRYLTSKNDQTIIETSNSKDHSHLEFHAPFKSPAINVPAKQTFKRDIPENPPLPEFEVSLFLVPLLVRPFKES